MQAAVYKGQSVVSVEQVPIPEIGPGEMLVRVEACGICHTDLKKIEYNLLAPPRIYGHETAGVVVRRGAGVTRFAPGDRVVVFHHIPCGNCFYCRRKLYAQCPVYKKVGVTAGFEPAGGGFSQYVRVMDWIVEQRRRKDSGRRVIRTRQFRRAGEHLSEGSGTMRSAAGRSGGGHGPGAHRPDVHYAAAAHRRDHCGDRHDRRRAAQLSRRCGAWKPGIRATTDVDAEVRRLTDGRGADLVIVAASVPGIVDQAIRLLPSGRANSAYLRKHPRPSAWKFPARQFAWASARLFGCYSASVDLQKESAELVFSGALPVEELISHRVPLDKIRSGFDLALHPGPESLKIIVQPQRWTQ